MFHLDRLTFVCFSILDLKTLAVHLFCFSIPDFKTLAVHHVVFLVMILKRQQSICFGILSQQQESTHSVLFGICIPEVDIHSSFPPCVSMRARLGPHSLAQVCVARHVHIERFHLGAVHVVPKGHALDPSAALGRAEKASLIVGTARR